MRVEFSETPVANDVPIFFPFSPDRDDHYTLAIASGHLQLEESLIFIKNFFRTVAPAGRSFIDVGANCGIYTLVVGALGMPVMSIEALPDNYILLFSGIRKNGFRNIRPVLAAATSELELLHIEGSSAWGYISADGLPIPGVTLDDLIKFNSFASPALIKVDVEGHELQVLQGTLETIGQLRDVDFVIEIFPGHEQSLRLLEDHGYHCYMIKQGALIPTLSTDFIECQVTDFYCTRRLITASSFAEMPVLTRTPALSIAMLTAEARDGTLPHRLAIGARLQHAPADILHLPEVQSLLDGLQADADPGVRAVVNAWRTPR